VTELITPLIQWLNDNPQLAGIVTFAISAGESVAILGTVVPGSIMMTGLGALAGAGVIPLWSTILWAILGAVAGDGISYWLGFAFKGRLPSLWPFRSYPTLLSTGETFFYKYGSMSVFLGRFVGPVRALVPLVAGMLGMRPLQFMIANITSAIGWAPLYMLPGILLGAASLELPPDIAIHVMLVFLLMLLFILLCLWFIYKMLFLIHKQTDQLQSKIWHYLEQTPQLRFTTRLLKNHTPDSPHGQLNLFFYLLLAGVVFVALAFYIKTVGAANIPINEAVLHLFRGLRNNLDLDDIMLITSIFGQKEVLLPVVIVLFGLFLWWRRFRVAFHILALGILAAGGVFIIKRVIASPRPWGILHSPDTFSFPSGHTTLSACILMGLALLLAQAVRPGRRFIIYLTALIIILAISLSRLYLSAHWFTDILGGWLLSAVVLLVVTISYNRRKESPPPFGRTLLASTITLLLTATTYYVCRFNQMQMDYAQMDWPTVNVTMDHWWSKNDALSAYQTSLFGFPSQKLNIAWVGNLNQIRKTLLNEGWEKPPVRDWISTLHRLADIESTQYLPLVSPQYLDQKPALILAKRTNAQKNLLVIRLWDANRRIKETNETLWVGMIEIVPRSYSWIYKTKLPALETDPALIFSHQKSDQVWEWKVMHIDLFSDTPKMVHQKMIFIRLKKDKVLHGKRAH
jgi:membrane protein DedA with SNARE-associated domain/membrane-associated phospholipid phosphatase